MCVFANYTESFDIFFDRLSYSVAVNDIHPLNVSMPTRGAREGMAHIRLNLDWPLVFFEQIAGSPITDSGNDSVGSAADGRLNSIGLVIRTAGNRGKIAVYPINNSTGDRGC